MILAQARPRRRIWFEHPEVAPSYGSPAWRAGEHEVERWARLLTESGLAPGALTLEITESFLLDDTDSAADTLAKLKDLGVRIALDDFGTGYSSLTHLDRFPVDVLKIDKSFVDALGTGDHERTSLVSAIVNLGMMLGLHVTAEGIEGASQLARLRTKPDVAARPAVGAGLERLTQLPAHFVDGGRVVADVFEDRTGHFAQHAVEVRLV